MLKITCAQCNASLQVKPTLAGRTIRCPRCKQPTLVALAPVALEPEVEEVEIVEDADDEAGDAAFMPVAAKSPPKSAGKSPAKSTAKQPSRNDEAEFEPEFEMDDAPAKSRKGLWIGLGIGSGVLGLVVAGVAVWMMMPPPAPRDPFAQLKAKVEAELKAKGIKIEPENAPHSPVEAEPKKIVAAPPKIDPKTPVDPKTPTSTDLNPKDPVPDPTTPPKKGKIDSEPAPPEHVAAAPKADPRPTAKSPTKTAPTKTTPPVVTTLPVVKTPPMKSPEVVKTAAPPIVGKTTVGDLVFETVKVDAKNVVRSLTWAVDGKSFYCLQSTGKLQRFGADDLSVLADADLGA
ncbi:MAG TPA: hypothetical protein VHR72_09915, partial [Gemmataceae bacterium]|nr:hypothetical protein [Gemmataceae bacterium]